MESPLVSDLVAAPSSLEFLASKERRLAVSVATPQRAATDPQSIQSLNSQQFVALTHRMAALPQHSGFLPIGYLRLS